MKSFMKAICLTLLFCAYTFFLLVGGMCIQKHNTDIENAQKEALEQQQKQNELNARYSKTASEYHRYYEIVVSRIKTAELQGVNKDALKEYIAGYDKRFQTLADSFFPDREKPNNGYGSSFSTIFNEFKKAFDESEIVAYKNIIKSTGLTISEEDLSYIFEEHLPDGVEAPAKSPSPASSVAVQQIPVQQTTSPLVEQPAVSKEQTAQTDDKTEKKPKKVVEKREFDDEPFKDVGYY